MNIKQEKPKAIDVANFFIKLANDAGEEGMTNLRVNKLLYFAQAWSLARLGKELFAEDFQVWSLGPVLPEIYRTFQKYGKNVIPEVYGMYSEKVFSSEQVELLLDVAREYRKFSTTHLVDITHIPEGPWGNVYAEGAKKVTPKQDIKDYFLKQQPLKRFELDFSQFERMGHRDSQGHLVLSKEEDAEWGE